jgi:phosphomannomutase/phosphoglucomutase
MNPTIFREYDIRGKVPDDLNEATVYELGLCIGTYFKSRGAKKITLGRDCRLSSPSLRDCLLNGLKESGMHVIDIGMVPTPLLYFSLFHLDVHGGIQITGSHNPPDFNGFKVCPIGRQFLVRKPGDSQDRRIRSACQRHGEGRRNR